MIKDEVRKPDVPATRKPERDFTDQLIEPFSHLRREVDRLFDNFPFRMPSLRVGNLMAAWPPVEMSETGSAYKITAELPGLDPENVDVSCDNGVLRIAGEKQEKREEDEQGYRLSERSYGSFERLIRLPSAADDQQIKAKFKDGLLTVKIGKNSNQETARRIKVETEA